VHAGEQVGHGRDGLQAHAPALRDLRQLLSVAEAAAHHHVGLVLAHGGYQEGYLIGAMLAVAVEDDEDVGAQLARRPEARGQRLALAPVFTVPDQPRPRRLGHPCRGVT
jgi:hypothetical protein